MIVYLSGERNEELLEAWEQKFIQVGWNVVNSCTISEEYPCATLPDCIKRNFEWIDRCDCVFFPEGWENDAMSVLEIVYAFSMRKIFMFEQEVGTEFSISFKLDRMDTQIHNQKVGDWLEKEMRDVWENN